MSSIFLSHSSKDKQFVRRFGADLRRAGHTVWIDEAEIRVGDSLVEKIREGIDRVDFVAAVLSDSSVRSEWVKRELDIASNREIEEKRVVVLPVLISTVELPGFLKGKRYADFRDESGYEQSLADILRSLGPSSPVEATGAELEKLRAALSVAEAAIDTHVRNLDRHQRLVRLTRSAKLENAIDEENADSPEYALINNSYAFEIDGFPVTLGHVMWSVWKSQRQGGPSPLDLFLEVHDAWDQVKLMLEAYGDYLGVQRKPKRKRTRRNA